MLGNASGECIFFRLVLACGALWSCDMRETGPNSPKNDVEADRRTRLDSQVLDRRHQQISAE